MLHLIIFFIILIIFILISAPISLNYNYNLGIKVFLLSENPLLMILCILICILSVLFLVYILFFINKIIRKKYSLFIIITIILMITTIFFFSPILLFLFTFLTGGILLSLIFSTYIERWILKEFSSKKLLDILESLNIVKFFFKIYYNIFISSTNFNFLVILYGLHICSFFYVLLARIYIITSVVYMISYSPFISFLIYLNIFLCLILFFFRFLINLSLPLIDIISIHHPAFYEKLLLMEVGEEQVPTPQNKEQSSSSMPRNNYSLVSRNVNKTINNYHYPISSRQFSWRYFGYTMGVCTLGVGCLTAYYSYQAVQEAQKANKIAQRVFEEAQKANEISQRAVQATIDNTKELTRQNDLELVSQSKMSWDNYCKKHGSDCI